MASKEGASGVAERVSDSLHGEGAFGNPYLQAVVRYSPLYAIALLWEFAGLADRLPHYLPAPHVVVAQMVTMLQSGELVTHAVASLSLIYVGFTGAALAGIGMGILTGRYRRIGLVFDPLVSSIYPIPKIALFPLFLVWLGLGFNSKVVVLAIAVFFPMYVNTNDGVRTIDKFQIWSARNYGASRLRILKDVIVPSALPHIFSGLRVSLALSFIVVFSTEMISASVGLGHLVMAAQRGQNFPLMYASILTIALLGFAHNRVLVRLQDRALYWTEAKEGL